MSSSPEKADDDQIITAAQRFSAPKPKNYVGPINWNSEAFRYIKKFACSNKKEATHLSLVGGKGGAYDLHGDRTNPQESYRVNEDLLFQALASDRAAGNQPSYLVEMRGELFPPLYDFDMHGVDDTPLEKLEPLLRCVQRVVQQVYPQLSDFERRAIICTAALTTKERTVQKGFDSYRMKLQKRGYHLIYPGIVTDQQDALFVRHAVVQALEKEFGDSYISFIDPADGERVFCDNYDDLVDPTVITDNGLRMIGAHKSAMCPNGCKRGREWDKDNACPLCYNWGRIDEGRPYSVLASVDGSGTLYTLDDDHSEHQNPVAAELARLANNFYEALKTLSIRRALNDANVTKTAPNWSACEFDDSVRKKVAQQEGKKGAKGVSVQKVNENYVEMPGTYTLGRGKWTTVYETARGFAEVVSFLRKAYFQEPWRKRRDGVNVGESLWKAMGEGIKCMGVDKSKTKPAVRAYPLLNFCPNQGRTHTSNRTYLDLYWDATKSSYVLRPGCFSTNSPGKGRDPCNKARRFFAEYQVEVNEAVELHILRLVNMGDKCAVIRSEDLMPPAPEHSPDPERIYTSATQHNFCYNCRRYLTPKDSHMTNYECKCATPLFAPKVFDCAVCNKPFRRSDATEVVTTTTVASEKKKKRKRRQMPCEKTAHLPDACTCDKPTAPENLRNTMGPDVIKNSTLQ